MTDVDDIRVNKKKNLSNEVGAVLLNPEAAETCKEILRKLVKN